jgi:predicted NUDIX family NTP pyrophosphohydrolase
MPPKLSAGILLYRFRRSQLEVFLVHPGGPFWRNKDAGAWSLPKGEYLSAEDPLHAAKREFQEETGFAPPAGDYIPLDHLRQAGGKVVTAWAVKCDSELNGNSEHGIGGYAAPGDTESHSASHVVGDSESGSEVASESDSAADGEPVKINSNTFSMKWPPKSDRIQQFPEVDRAAWFSFATARTKILTGQSVFLDRLAAHLTGS